MSLYALVDCNNFYASCERVFAPYLTGRPVVVLSNNDGCVIARSDEAKAAGIPMGAPFHQYEEQLKRHHVAVFSSNYALYGDMSARVMKSLHTFTPDVEVYSIDEAFLGLNGFDPRILPHHMKEMRAAVKQWTGIPVSVGIAPTKTLAKLANRIAKKYTSDGVYMMKDPALMTRILGDIEVEDIWGISKRWGARLRQMGIGTALQLREASPRQIRQSLSVVGERIVHELNGHPCLMLEDVQPKQTIMSSRSFGSMVTKKAELEEAVASYTARAAEKLRRQSGRAGSVYVFLRTNRFRKQDPQYSNAAMVGFDNPTSDTATLIRAAVQAIGDLYRSGYRYHKAGVMLMELTNAHEGPISLLNPEPEEDRQLKDKRMAVLDKVNRQMGRGTLFHAAEGIAASPQSHDNQKNERRFITGSRFRLTSSRHSRPSAKIIGTERWRMRSQFKSPSYTTQWHELAVVK